MQYKCRFLSSLFLMFFIPGLSAQTPPRGQDLFDHVKDLLVRVKAADSISSPKSSYGTGFVVDKSGIIATNYHVISDYVMQPGNQWKIIVETQDLKNIEAELIGLSVVDDLALIRINQSFPGALPFENKTSFKGEKSYSLGLPNDINMSLIEGVYNGVLNHGPYSLVHVTTPLNGGMSGGPTVNSAGKLIGINVARILFANDISFIVPVERLLTLVKKTDFKGLP
ncbi:MAG: serine protease [Bdellovibrionota bacterium]